MLAITLLASAALAGGATLDIAGECPGMVEVEASGFAPGATVAVLTGLGVGSDVMARGACAGERTSLAGVAFVKTVRADPEGTIHATPTLGDGMCGRYVQFIDTTTCEGSNVDAIGSPEIADNEECWSYTTLDDAWRNVEMTGDVYCDNDAIEPDRWYRIEGDAGTQMPEWAPDTYMCSTHAPGWLDGSHPVGVGASEDVRTCWHWSDNVCNWSSETTVTNCGPFYVYFMRALPFACSGVHCGE